MRILNWHVSAMRGGGSSTLGQFYLSATREDAPTTAWHLHFVTRPTRRQIKRALKWVQGYEV